jgi:hypothetical protein
VPQQIRFARVEGFPRRAIEDTGRVTERLRVREIDDEEGRRRIAMTVTVISSVTVDGVVQAPARPDEDTRDGFTHGGWAVPYGDDEAATPRGAKRSPGPPAAVAGSCSAAGPTSTSLKPGRSAAPTTVTPPRSPRRPSMSPQPRSPSRCRGRAPSC